MKSRVKRIVVPMAAALLASPQAAAFRTEISAIDDAGGAGRVFRPSGTAILGGGFDLAYPSGTVGLGPAVGGKVFAVGAAAAIAALVALAVRPRRRLAGKPA